MIPRYTTPEMRKLWSEEEKFALWLEVERAVAWAQGELGLIPKEVSKELETSSFDLHEIEEFEAETQHDLLSFLKSVERRMGKWSNYLHFGLTSYDVVDTALALRLRKACELINGMLGELSTTLKDLALKYKYTPMIGRTHGIWAQPITFGLKCLSWWAETERNRSRLEEVQERISYGKLSGAVGGYSLPPQVEELVLDRLKLKPEPVATQVVPRDRHAELLMVLGLIASGFERIATELRNLQRSELGEVSEGFASGQLGSSAMPHKRNPIRCERICGLARVIRSYLTAGYETIALWGERDLTNSSVERITLPDSTTLLHYTGNLLTQVLKGLQVYPERMLKNLESAQGQFYSQPLLMALIRKGMARDEAYKLVQRLSFQTERESRELKAVARADEAIMSRLSPEELKEIFDLNQFFKEVDYIYKKTGLE
jgi:adenylosuccinate lyase